MYNSTYNYDNSVLRYLIISLLSDLRDKIYYYQQNDNNITKVDIPFFYSLTGAERFLKDEFEYDSINNNKAIGDYEKVPRCVISMTDTSINTSNQTNKFTRVKFIREVDGILKEFYLRCCFLPIDINFNCQLLCSSNIECLKITESIMSKLYSTNIFYIDLGMMHIQSSYSLPTNYNNTITIDYSMDTKKEYKMDFTLNVNTFIPVFEHGILLDEITNLLRDNKVDDNKTIMLLRSDEYGNLGIYHGGIITKFYVGNDAELDVKNIAKKIDNSREYIESNIDLENTKKPNNIFSNTNEDIDYTIKTAGYNELQNKQ